MNDNKVQKEKVMFLIYRAIESEKQNDEPLKLETEQYVDMINNKLNALLPSD